MIVRRYIRGDALPGRYEDIESPAVDVLGHQIPECVVTSLGRSHVEYILRHPNPVGVCDGRIRGAWDSNDLELQATYTALAACLRPLRP